MCFSCVVCWSGWWIQVHAHGKQVAYNGTIFYCCSGAFLNEFSFRETTRLLKPCKLWISWRWCIKNQGQWSASSVTWVLFGFAGWAIAFHWVTTLVCKVLKFHLFTKIGLTSPYSLGWPGTNLTQTSSNSVLLPQPPGCLGYRWTTIPSFLYYCF